MVTALDQIANQNHLQIAKAILPYLPSHQQRTASVCIKLMEMQNIMNYYHHNDNCISACSTHPASANIRDILTDIRNYCDEEEQAVISQWLQLFSTIELYTMLSQTQADPSPGT